MSHPAVEARRLGSEAGIAVVLFDWTGPIVRDGRRFPRVTSHCHGPLLCEPEGGTNLRVTLLLEDVLLLEP